MFLGIDVGTQSVKALLYDADRQRVAAMHSAPLDLVSAADGTREQHADWWLTALRDCLSKFEKSERGGVKALAVSGQQHGFVALNTDGEVLAPVKLWCDTSTVEQCTQITEAFGGRQRCIAELGNPILPGYTASKILWLKQHRPQQYAQLATILLPHDYVNYYLTGERSMECGDASGTGLLDIRKRQWHAGILAALDSERDLAQALPPLAAAGAVMGRLRATAASELGLQANIPVACGGGDNMMAAIGTGSVCAGRMTVSLGTSGTVFATADKPVVDSSGIMAAFCSSTGAWLPLLCTMNCTAATELTRQLLAMDIDALESATARVPPGANGVLTLPFFNGERSPDLPHGKGCIFGLDSTNYSPGNLLRSAMEAAVYGLRGGLEALQTQGCGIDSVRLTGGGAASAVWRQMVADVFDLPVTVQSIDEGAALGAALQALWVWQGSDGDQQALQRLVDVHLTTDAERGCAPRTEIAQRYNEYYQHYRRHIEAVRHLYT